MALPIGTVLALMALLLTSGVWIGIALLGVGAGALSLLRSMPVERLLGQITWNSVTSPELVALPLFVLMAELLFRTRLSELLFTALVPWTQRLPGRLLHVNVLGCTLFATITGSSAATTVTVGKITAHQLLKRGYNKDLVMGSLAGAGTLGFLIPPSTMMIIYGVLSQTSIIRLFIAGIIPGLCIAALYMAYLGAVAKLRPGIVPDDRTAYSWGERFRAALGILPIAGLIVAVMGSMYTGLASPSEAAAVGVFGALVLAIAQRGLTPRSLWEALVSAACTTSMIGLIIAGAMFLSTAMGFLGIPRAAASLVESLGLSPFMLMVVLLGVYILLGCVLEGLSLMVMTLPITLPMVVAAGYDPIWFGIFLILVIELAQITPPVGFNLFVLQSLTGEPIYRIAKATFPFFVIMALFTLFVSAVPELVTWLPDRMAARN